MERSSARARIGPASIAVSSNGLSGPVWGVLKSPNPALLVAFESCSDAKISTSGMTARKDPLGKRRHGRRLDVAVVVFLVVGCLFVAGRASLRAVGLTGDAPPEAAVLEVAVGKPLSISAETDESALLGFYSPEDHGAWLGSGTGRLRLGVSDGSRFQSVRVLLLAANTGDDPTKVITVTVDEVEKTVELESGTSEWLTFDVSSSDSVDVAIQCSPAADPGDGDVRALCALLSAVGVAG